MNQDRDRDLHPLLCAYLLDELLDADRARIEHALANDATLRAEKARLEVVLGMVTQAFPRDLALSDASRAALVAEAERRVAAAPPTGTGFATIGSVALAAALLIAVAVKLALPPLEPTAGSNGRESLAARDSASNRTQGAAERLGADPGDVTSDARAAGSTEAPAGGGKREPGPAGAAPAPVAVASSQTAATSRPPVMTPASKEGYDRDGPTTGGAVLYRGPGDAVPAGEPTKAARAPNPGLAGDGKAQGDVEQLGYLGVPGGGAAGRKDARVLLLADAPSADIRDRVESRFSGHEEARDIIVAAGVRLDEPNDLDRFRPSRSYDFGGFGDGPNAAPADAKQAAEWIVHRCRRLPNEKPSMMYFRFWGDNAFVLAALDPLSTFAADVDTASYALARRYLNDGVIPEKAQIRTEEFVNYFDPDVAPPTEGTFAIELEAAPSLFGGAPDRWLLRVTLRGREVPERDRLPQRLTFVVDTSGSMRQENRIELVKHALRLLVAELRPNDQIALVRFANDASLVLPMTPASNRAVIEQAIHSLAPDGSTNAEAGLKLGYAQAAQTVDPEALSRVIFLSDGVANVGQTDQDRINSDVAAYRAQGIYLNTIGVGMGNHDDVFLEQLADKGDGLCNYVDSAQEARRALVDNFVGAIVPIARDVKIQLEFDSELVRRYRLLGYENRAIADADFRNAAVDAGEVGSGHQVAALYEIEVGATVGAGARPFATARVRFKPPHGEGDAESEIERSIQVDSVKPSYEEGAPGYRRSTLVAQFAELLRRSTHAQGDSLDLLVHEAAELAAELHDDDVTEFSRLVAQSRALIISHLSTDDPLTQAIDTVRRNAILRAELEDLSGAEDKELLDRLEQENERLERQIRDLLEKRLESPR